MKANRTPSKGFFKTYLSGLLRFVAVALLIVAQFVIICLLSLRLTVFGLYFYVIAEFAAILVVIGLMNNRASIAYKTAWLTIIALLPIAGIIMYLLWGRSGIKDRIKKKNLDFINNINSKYAPDGSKIPGLEKACPGGAKLARLAEYYGFPLTSGNSFRYFASGEQAFDALIGDLESAESFIFLSFFIVADGALWERIRPVLIERAKAGVEVRMMYDDFGSILRTDKQFWQTMDSAGIRTASFNRITRYLSKLYLNYRNHQKIVVVDGKVGYTGGFNLADEYINAIRRFGHWKDGGIRIEGPAVTGLTSTFLGMWDMTVESAEEDISRYTYEGNIRGGEALSNTPGDTSFCQIISDGPENNPDNPILDIITGLFYEARGYLYITTPYLVIEERLSDALLQAARSGVDVRIITPGIPDKKMVYQLTKYNYGRLLEGGVRIFEYTPGFIHIKNIITPDVGIIGTINLDYRSLFLHYECGALLWDREALSEARADFEATLNECREVDFKEWKSRPLMTRILQWILNLFASEV